jgi:Replication protein
VRLVGGVSPVNQVKRVTCSQLGRRNMFTDDSRQDADGRESYFSQANITTHPQALPEWCQDALADQAVERGDEWLNDPSDPRHVAYRDRRFPAEQRLDRDGGYAVEGPASAIPLEFIQVVKSGKSIKAGPKVKEDMGLRALRKLDSKPLIPFLYALDKKRARKLAGCGALVVMREHFQFDDADGDHIRTCEFGSFCCQPRLCIGCAHVQAVKRAVTLTEKVCQVFDDDRDLDLWMLTFTVKNGEDLAERREHLQRSVNVGMERGRNNRRGNGRPSVFADFHGMVSSVEIKRGRGGLWHPHLHALVAVQKSAGWRPQMYGQGHVLESTKHKQICDEWNAITGDSYNVNIKPLQTTLSQVVGQPVDAKRLIAECFEVVKYSFKPAEMSPLDIIHAFQATQGIRLCRSYGCFYGVKLVEEWDDEPLCGITLRSSFKWNKEGGYEEMSTVLYREVKCQWGGCKVERDGRECLAVEGVICGLKSVIDISRKVAEICSVFKSDAKQKRSQVGEAVFKLQLYSFEWVDEEAGVARLRMVDPAWRVARGASESDRLRVLAYLKAEVKEVHTAD